MITRPALPGELSTDAPRLGFPRPARIPADFAELVNAAWGDGSLPEPADIRELATRYETERPDYAAHGCSVEYTVESLVEDLRCERDEEFRAELAAEEREYHR